jgi:hypothetical protein
MKVLVVGIGRTNVKILASGQTEPRKFPSGPTMTPRQMVSSVKKLARDTRYGTIIHRVVFMRCRMLPWRMKDCSEESKHDEGSLR